eukprot:Nitzschia sp. Nitz4//NODE_202_length_38933_cov_72.610268//35801//36972//NITZ4_additional_000028-RA//-1//CDS//3329531804//4033//frame0
MTSASSNIWASPTGSNGSVQGRQMSSDSRDTSPLDFFRQQSEASQQYLQPLTDLAKGFQGNLIKGLDVATQVLLLKALSNQASEAGGSADPTDSAQLLLAQLRQRHSQPSVNPTTKVHVHVPSTSYQVASQALLAAARSSTLIGQGQRNPLPSQQAVSCGPQSTPTVPFSTATPHPPRPAVVAPVESSSKYSIPVEDKKQQKRAANRISAQQSRKRRKEFIEELKVENEELRRLGQVFSVVPDPIVAFDFSGGISFASQASEQVFGSSPNELVGTSFWNLLCSKSSRRLKTAFMDALAARDGDATSVPFGGKVWEIQFKNTKEEATDCTYLLNGVLHFNGSTPECVCSIRRSPGGPLGSGALPLQVLA